MGCRTCLVLTRVFPFSSCGAHKDRSDGVKAKRWPSILTHEHAGRAHGAAKGRSPFGRQKHSRLVSLLLTSTITHSSCTRPWPTHTSRAWRPKRFWQNAAALPAGPSSPTMLAKHQTTAQLLCRCGRSCVSLTPLDTLDRVVCGQHPYSAQRLPRLSKIETIYSLEPGALEQDSQTTPAIRSSPCDSLCCVSLLVLATRKRPPRHKLLCSSFAAACSSDLRV